MNLFNANLDASAEQQKTDRQLRRELTEWDRGQDESMRMKAKGGLVNEKKAKNWVVSVKFRLNLVQLVALPR